MAKKKSSKDPYAGIRKGAAGKGRKLYEQVHRDRSKHYRPDAKAAARDEIEGVLSGGETGKPATRTRIMGIDPGTRVVGYGVVDLERNELRHVAHGALDVRKGTDYPERLRRIFEGLSEAIQQYQPDICVVEEIFHARSAKSAIKTGEGRGVALLAAAVGGVPVVEYAATRIKKSVTGVGSAHKSQVQKMVRLQLGLKTIPTPADASDALACAICHCHRLRFKSI